MNIVLQAGYALALLSGILVGVDYIILLRRRKNRVPHLAEQALAVIAMESKLETLQEKLDSTRQDLMVKVSELAGLTSLVIKGSAPGAILL
jgi:uncharacterized membrane-anchored protein YhcB (DUF1043 family)